FFLGSFVQLLKTEEHTRSRGDWNREWNAAKPVRSLLVAVQELQQLLLHLKGQAESLDALDFRGRAGLEPVRFGFPEDLQVLVVQLGQPELVVGLGLCAEEPI